MPKPFGGAGATSIPNGSNRPPGVDCLRHWAFLMRQEVASVGIEAPSNAPAVRPDLRPPAGEVDARRVEVGDHSIGVSDVNGSGEFVERLAERLIFGHRINRMEEASL